MIPLTRVHPGEDLDSLTLEARLKQIELHLGLRRPDAVEPPTHAVCSFSGLKLSARFFGVPTTHPKPVSQFYNAYKSAKPDDRARMAVPRTLEQETFDTYEAKFFPKTDPLSTKRVQEFLLFAGAKGLGSTTIQHFTNRTHASGL